MRVNRHTHRSWGHFPSRWPVSALFLSRVPKSVMGSKELGGEHVSGSDLCPLWVCSVAQWLLSLSALKFPMWNILAGTVLEGSQGSQRFFFGKLRSPALLSLQQFLLIFPKWNANCPRISCCVHGPCVSIKSGWKFILWSILFYLW